MTTNDDLPHMEMWSWDAVHVVISSNVKDTSGRTGQVACKVHSKGKRFGFTVDLPDFVNQNVTENDTQNWIESIKDKQKMWYADHVVVDLIKPLSDTASVTKAILNPINALMTKASQTDLNRRLYCIVPWLPPCTSDEEDCATTKSILNNCEMVILGPDSYIPDTRTGCVAQATIPIGQFLLGINKYLFLLQQMKIVAGIPWHGYNYSCASTNKLKHCILTDSTTKPCKYQDIRKQISLGQIDLLGQAFQKNATVDRLSQSVCYTSPNMNDLYQIWFENIETLNLKYSFVKDLGLAGFAIWYAEDLKYGLDTSKLQNDRNMWGWVLHQILVETDHTAVPKGHVYADTVAGVGVGCLVLGTALGITFACIALRRCDSNRSKLNRPFKLDDDDEEYRDDNGL